MNPLRASFSVGHHLVGIDQVEQKRFRVTVDGVRLASFCSESRARAAGRAEARRLEVDARGSGRSLR